MLCDKLRTLVSHISLPLDGVTFVHMHTSFVVRACNASAILMYIV